MRTPKTSARVSEAVRRRRSALGLTVEEAAAKGGMSPTTWVKVEKHGQPVTVLVSAGVCRALDWPHDMLDRIAQGEDPPIDPDGSVTISRLEQLEARMTAFEIHAEAQERLVLHLRDVVTQLEQILRPSGR